ncbi:MAG: DUF2971 domain-containing protein [Candidatus Nitrotoga sp.]|nr:DUF2971 domain-containing protein [Candidatus Nitrotoga sp.]
MEQSEFEERFVKMERWWESLRSELAAIISESPPIIIYHYTDINGLLGMILSGKIWATHISRLNDSSEYHHGIKVVADCVRAAMPASSKLLVEKILSEFEKVETYVASYSTEYDLLSQWRSYSGGKVGYCLGLSTDRIATLDGSTPLLEAVIYKDDLAQQVISTMLNRVDKYLQDNQFGDVEVGFLLGMVGGTLANLACTIKHPKFEEENEYRQFYQPGATSLQLENKFRNGRFGLTSYVEVPFIEEGRLPLRSVTIGPCQDAELEMSTVKTLLEKYSYTNVEVLISEIPLRV